MDSLSPDRLRELRGELKRRLSRLRRSMRISDEASLPVELDQAAGGRLSRVDSLQSQSMAKSLRERERVELALIEDALRRIAEGTYGLCVACRTPVRYERLLVFPEVPTCQACS